MNTSCNLGLGLAALLAAASAANSTNNPDKPRIVIRPIRLDKLPLLRSRSRREILGAPILSGRGCEIRN